LYITNTLMDKEYTLEKQLTLFVDDKDGNPIGFPSSEDTITVVDFTANYQRMEKAPTITCTVKHHKNIDKEWNYNVYANFKGERFYLTRIPSSSYSNKDSRHIYNLELRSERVKLEQVYVFDVDAEGIQERPVSNNSVFNFFGTVQKFAELLNASLNSSGLYDENATSGYCIVVDTNTQNSEEKPIALNNTFFIDALKEVYNTWNIPFSFEGKKIVLSTTAIAPDETFEYGASNSLISIEKQNANATIVNRITGFGSEDNIPYYYPNLTPLGNVYLQSKRGEGFAVIGDKTKFARNKAGNEFWYYHVIGGVDYPPLTPVIGEGYPQHKGGGYYEYVINCVFEYRVPLGSIGRLDVHIEEIDSKSSSDFVPKISIMDDFWNGGSTFEYFFDKVKTGLSEHWQKNVTLHTLTEKSYCWLSLTVYLDRDDYTANDVFDNLYKISLKTTWDEEKYWKLKNKTIHSIEDYGITVLAEPKDGDYISIVKRNNTWIDPQNKLMPSIYRTSEGKKRFYNAKNGEYKNNETGAYYTFKNQYIEGQPLEHIQEFEDIKPSIVGVKNSANLPINVFEAFVYDDNDSDEKDANGDPLHPYFFAKLRKFDGKDAFNLFHHAIEKGEMTFSMTSGKCGGCQWTLAVNEDTKKNLVQVDEDGNPKKDDDGDVICGRKGPVEPQDKQQDTINNNVWVALKKDTQTYHTVMPSKTKEFMPATGDSFVILNMYPPYAFITAAEDKLEQELLKYMAENNEEKYNFSIKFSRIYLAENPGMLQFINENSALKVKYKDDVHVLYVKSITYNMKGAEALPEIVVDLSESVDPINNALQIAVNKVEERLEGKIETLDVVAATAPFYHRKDISDKTSAIQTFSAGIKVGDKEEFGLTRQGSAIINDVKTDDFVEGASGAAIYKDERGTHIEADYLNIRRKATFKEVQIETSKHIGGSQILSAAECKCDDVESLENGDYKVYFRRYSGDGELITNKWAVGDLARCDTFNMEQNKDGTVSNRFYWRKVTEVGTGGYTLDNRSMTEYHWIVLGNQTENGDFAFGSTYPLPGDDIYQLGHNGDDKERQNAIVIAGAGSGSPYIRQYTEINEFYLPEPDTQIKPNANVFSGQVVIQGGSGIENLDGFKDKVNDVVDFPDFEVGVENLLRNTGFDGEYESIDPTSEKWDVGEYQNVANDYLAYWNVSDQSKVKAKEKTESKSGWCCHFTEAGCSIEQEVLLNSDTKYSFSAQTDRKFNLSVNGASYQTEYDPTTQIATAIIYGSGVTKIKITSTGKCDVWHVMLSRGNVFTDWRPSVQDVDPVANNIKALWYLQDALRGDTLVSGGLLLTKMIKLGLFKDGEFKYEKAGISGIMNGNEDVAFWAGGSFDEAITTISKIRNGINNITTDEWNNLIGFVATHGGDMFLKGYIYAKGGVFQGELKAATGTFSGELQAATGTFKGKLEAASGSFSGEVNATSGVFNDVTIQGNSSFSGVVNIQAGSGGLENLNGFEDAVTNAIKIGGENLLRNTGFDGEFEPLEDPSNPPEGYDNLLRYWSVSTLVASTENTASASGRQLSFARSGTGYYAQQRITLPAGTYTFSAKANKAFTASFGGQTKPITVGSVWCFTLSSETTSDFSITPTSSSTNIWEVKLERGNVATDWSPSPRDVNPAASGFKSLWYLQKAMLDGTTKVNGGLILSSLIQLGQISQDSMTVTAGMNGVVSDGSDVAFWSGGTLANAASTINAVTAAGGNITEAQLDNLAGFVATHDGQMFLKGYIYAKGGVFAGELKAATGTFKGKLEAASGSFSGEVNATSGVFNDVTINQNCWFKGELLSATGSLFGYNRSVMTVITPDNIKNFSGGVIPLSETFPYYLDIDKTGYCMRFTGRFNQIGINQSEIKIRLPYMCSDGTVSYGGDNGRDRIRTTRFDNILIYNDSETDVSVGFKQGTSCEDTVIVIPKGAFARFTGKLVFYKKSDNTYTDILQWDYEIPYFEGTQKEMLSLNALAVGTISRTYSNSAPEIKNISTFDGSSITVSINGTYTNQFIVKMPESWFEKNTDMQVLLTGINDIGNEIVTATLISKGIAVGNYSYFTVLCQRGSTVGIGTFDFVVINKKNKNSIV
jgi:hypothetical protein